MPNSLPRWLIILLALLAALMLYFAFWPVPIQPVAWEAQAAPGYTGAHALNTRLSGLQKIDIGKESGPEHIAMGRDGKLYAAVSSGAILRMNPDGSELSTFVKTDGRVLGFDFDAQGNMIAASEVQSLLSISPAGQITVLADKVGNEPIKFADAVAVAKNGKIYLSDASTRFAPKDWGGSFEASVLDILEQSATGRILEYDPATKAMRIVAKGISFANGIALSANERQIFVAETGRYRVWRIDVNASDLDVRQTSGMSGATHIVLPNLPGYPDNLMRGLPTRDGKSTLWLGLAKPRSALVDKMAGKPWMRTLTLRLPRFLWPIPPKYGHVISFTEDGTVLSDLQDPSGAYPETTGVLEMADRLYVQSLHAGWIGWMKRP
jgi:sugar lactone lactonase YvrE